MEHGAVTHRIQPLRADDAVDIDYVLARQRVDAAGEFVPHQHRMSAVDACG